MGNMTTALTFVLLLNVFMFLTQASILNLNPDGTTYFHCNGTFIDEFSEEGNCLTLDAEDVSGQLPDAKASVSPTTGNIFTDIFSGIKAWFADTVGLKYLREIVKAPYNFMIAAKIPTEFALGLGVLWYGITLFLLIAFLTGRAD